MIGRRFKILGLLVLISGLIFPFVNCDQRSRFRTNDPNRIQNGTTVGNPAAPASEKLRADICSAIRRCHPQVGEDPCRAGVTSAQGFASALGLAPALDSFGSIYSAEASAAVVANSSAANLCAGHLQSISCTDPAVTAAYNPSHPVNAFAGAAELVNAPACGSVYVPNQYHLAVLADGPAAYWRLDEVSGSSALDSVAGLAADWSSMNGVSWSAAGAIPANTSVSLNMSASPGRLVTNGLSMLNTAAGTFITVEFWMRWSGQQSAQGSIPFTAHSNFYGLWLQTTERRFGFNTGTGDLYGIEGAAVSALAGQWVHVVAVLENGIRPGNMPNNKIYLNGVRQTLVQLMPPSSTPLRSVSSFFSISDPGYPFDGALDEFAIYNRELSAPEVLEHFNARN